MKLFVAVLTAFALALGAATTPVRATDTFELGFSDQYPQSTQTAVGSPTQAGNCSNQWTFAYPGKANLCSFTMDCGLVCGTETTFVTWPIRLDEYTSFPYMAGCATVNDPDFGEPYLSNQEFSDGEWTVSVDKSN
jgi:hypothetical protein